MQYLWTVRNPLFSYRVVWFKLEYDRQTSVKLETPNITPNLTINIKREDKSKPVTIKKEMTPLPPKKEEQEVRQSELEKDAKKFTALKESSANPSTINDRETKLSIKNVDASTISPNGMSPSQLVSSESPAEGTGFLTTRPNFTLLWGTGTLQSNPRVIASPTLPEQFELVIIRLFSSDNREVPTMIKSAKLEVRKKLVEEQITVCTMV